MNAQCNTSSNDLVIQFANNPIGSNDNNIIADSCNLGMTTLLAPNGGYNFMNKCPANGEFIETPGPSCDTYMNANITASVNPNLNIKGCWGGAVPPVGCFPYNPIKPDDWVSGSLNPSIKFDSTNGYISSCNKNSPANFSIDVTKPNISFDGTNVCQNPAYGCTQGNLNFNFNGGSATVKSGVNLPLPNVPGVLDNYQTACKRIAYSAPPLYGCISELSVHSKTNGGTQVFNVEDSYGGTGGNLTYRTVDPQYQPSNDSCSNVMTNFCMNPTIALTGQYPQLDNTDFKQWAVGGVAYTYATQYGTTDGRDSVITTSLDAINKKWPIQSYTSWSTNPSAVSAWKGILSAIKKNQTQAGSYALDRVCSTLTRDSIKNLKSDDLRYQACACHLPSDQYNSFLGIIDQGYYHACDPVCSVAALEGKVVGQYSDGNLVTCKQNNCIIDNTTINILNSNQGDITFDQVCGHPSGGILGSTTCYYKDISVFEQASTNGNINFGQSCGACYVGNVAVDCTTGEALTWWGKIKQLFSKKNIIIFIVVVIVIIALLIFSYKINSKISQQSYQVKMQQISELKSV